MSRSPKKVFVGLSGGVDSSVSAALLKKVATPKDFEKIFGRPSPEGFSGYDVIGVFIKVWQPDFLSEELCTWRQDRRDAIRVAAHLDIPFVTLDLEKEYKRDVVDYMVEGYKSGEVPNPDVMCNKTIKFGAFFDWARKHGADYVATGHYACLQQNDEFQISNFKSISNSQIKNSRIQSKFKIQNSKFRLLCGKDDKKDQSYFLWTLTQKQLKHVLFPIGEYTKPQVRKFAEKFELPTAQKKDSQGLCFLGKVDMKDFLKHFIPEKAGDALDENGNIIGYHDGATFFTLGQRHGFTVKEKGADDRPYFVIDKDIEKNTITLSHKPLNPRVTSTHIFLRDVNWISSIPTEGKEYFAKIRYQGVLEPCSIAHKDNNTEVLFKKAVQSITGQSVVLYDGDICLGGGVVS